MFRAITKFNILGHKGGVTSSCFHSSSFILASKATYPPRPKRPGSSYTIYVKEVFSKASKDTGLSTKEVMKTLSNQWNELNSSTKEKYQKQYNKLQEKFNSDLKKWEESLTSEDRLAYNSDIKRRSELSGKKLKTKKIRDPHLPKRPPSSYLLFCKDRREDPNSNISGLGGKEQAARLSQEWQGLDSHEKQKYNNMYQAATEKYQEALSKFKDN